MDTVSELTFANLLIVVATMLRPPGYCRKSFPIARIKINSQDFGDEREIGMVCSIKIQM